VCAKEQEQRVTLLRGAERGRDGSHRSHQPAHLVVERGRNLQRRVHDGVESLADAATQSRWIPRRGGEQDPFGARRTAPRATLEGAERLSRLRSCHGQRAAWRLRELLLEEQRDGGRILRAERSESGCCNLAMRV